MWVGSLGRGVNWSRDLETCNTVSRKEFSQGEIVVWEKQWARKGKAGNPRREERLEEQRSEGRRLCSEAFVTKRMGAQSTGGNSPQQEGWYNRTNRKSWSYRHFISDQNRSQTMLYWEVNQGVEGHTVTVYQFWKVWPRRFESQLHHSVGFVTCGKLICLLCV